MPHGYEKGTLKTAEGVLRLNVPHVRGEDGPYRSQVLADEEGHRR